MPQQAKVTSVDALRAFRTALILYVSKARPTLEEVTSDVVRTKLWLETDRQIYWEMQVRRRTRKLDEANQAVFGARLSSSSEVSASQMMALRRAKSELEEAETKLKSIKKWSREIDARIEPLTRQLEKLHTILSHDLGNAIAYLLQAAGTLDAYADVAASSDNAGRAASANPPAADPDHGQDIPTGGRA